MTVSIGRTQRYALFIFSAAGYVAALTGVDVPGDAQTANAPAFDRSPLATPAAPPDPARAAVRDPFAAAPDATATVEATSAAIAVPVPGGPPVPDIDLADARGVLAATRPSQPQPSETATPSLALRATIVGDVSVAYVSEGDAMQIVRAGDRLGTVRVTRIGLTSIAFDDGSRLSLETSPSVSAPPRRAGVALPQRRRQRGVPSPAKILVTPAATAVAASVTPAPMRTPDRNGIAPGANPTPDLADPTPFPYQYPYPPPRR